MIIALLSFSLILGADSVWQTEGSEIFRPLVHREVAVSADGTMYIVNRDQAKIMVFGPDGQFQKSFSSKGSGPGELLLPCWISIDGNRLFVEDPQFKIMTIFNTDGTFVDRVRVPNGNNFTKVRNGWVFSNWEDVKEPKASLFYANDHLKEATAFHSWPRPTDNLSLEHEKDASGRIPVPFNPAADEPCLAASKDLSEVYFIPQGSDDIHFFDVATRKLTKVKDNDNKAIPFNEEWAEAKYEETKLSLDPEFRKVFVLKKAFPEKFPVVNNLFVLPSGEIAVKLWSAWLEKMPRYQVFDRNGESKKVSYSPESLPRILAKVGNLCYVIVYDEDEGNIAAVPSENVSEYISANPIEYEGLTGNSVVFLNQ